MLKYKWTSTTIETLEDWNLVKNGIAELHFQVAAFDTETTGLHIIFDSPFLFTFGFLHPTEEKGFTFLVDLRYNPDAKQIIKEWHEIVKKCKVYLGHNVKFDLHMLHNIGLPYEHENLSDTQFYIRYACDALHQNEGGPSLKLKEFAAKYIDTHAKYHERLLDSEKSSITKSYNQKLKNRLAALGTPPPQFKAKSYTLKVMHDLFKDPIFELSDLPSDVRKIYLEWKTEDLPVYLQDKVTSQVESDMIRYSDLNRNNLYKYAHLDVVYTLEIYAKLDPILQHRQNQNAVTLENSNILPLVEMERAGFLVDKEYLENCRVHMREYILAQREKFKELAGQDIVIGQHAAIKSILRDRYGLTLPSTGSTELEKIHTDNQEAQEFIDTIQELRSLEKWYSTYIVKFQQELRISDRIYTTIHQVGTVSGRVSSDFQQFPKEPICDRDGNELFHPRRMVLCPPDCKYLLFLDYAAEELRVTAMYTILVGNPDTNMLRAYMPYKCIKKDDEYYLEENPEEKWEPVDLHAATTIAAGYPKDDPNFKHYRKTVGKRVNFAKNYGAAYGKIREMFPDKSEEECHRIDEAYYKAFPGLKSYHQYCFERARLYPYTTNLFGVKYYHVNGHKLRNVLVQGSCAHFLKGRIRALWEYLHENNLKSRIVMQIHDELVFEIKKGDPDIGKDLKCIMEQWEDALVPIVAEAEATTTNWAEKEEKTI